MVTQISRRGRQVLIAIRKVRPQIDRIVGISAVAMCGLLGGAAFVQDNLAAIVLPGAGRPYAMTPVGFALYNARGVAAVLAPGPEIVLIALAFTLAAADGAAVLRCWMRTCRRTASAASA